jgi:hypothetical protein
MASEVVLVEILGTAVLLAAAGVGSAIWLPKPCDIGTHERRALRTKQSARCGDALASPSRPAGPKSLAAKPSLVSQQAPGGAGVGSGTLVPAINRVGYFLSPVRAVAKRGGERVGGRDTGFDAAQAGAVEVGERKAEG